MRLALRVGLPDDSRFDQLGMGHEVTQVIASFTKAVGPASIYNFLVIMVTTLY